MIEAFNSEPLNIKEILRYILGINLGVALVLGLIYLKISSRARMYEEKPLVKPVDS